MTRTTKILSGGVLIALVLASGYTWRQRSMARGSTAMRAAPKAASGMDGMAGMSGMDGMQGKAASGEVAGRSGENSMAGMNMSGDGSVLLTASQLRQFGVTFGLVQQRMMSDESRATGTVVADQTRMSMITARYNGYVERLMANVEGQRIAAGQPLAAIFSPELVAAQEELLVARRLDGPALRAAIPGVADASGSLVAASTRRLKSLGLTDAQIGAVLRTGQPQRTVVLAAPTGGILTARHIVQGQAVTIGMPLFAVTDLSVVWIDVQVRASDAAQVHEGTDARIDVTGATGHTYVGRVSYIYPTVNATARTLTARVTIPNRDGVLKPGMYATVKLASASRTALTIPETAVVSTGDGAVVFVDMTGGDGSLRVLPQRVELGTISGGYAEVLSGLTQGQRVVTSAQYLLESESNLGEIMKGMIGMGQSMSGMDSAPAAKATEMSGMPGMKVSPAPVAKVRP